MVILSPTRNLEFASQPLSIAWNAFSIVALEVFIKSSGKLRSFLTLGATKPTEASLTFDDANANTNQFLLFLVKTLGKDHAIYTYHISKTLLHVIQKGKI